jgi:hypothetical protein
LLFRPSKVCSLPSQVPLTFYYSGLWYWALDHTICLPETICVTQRCTVSFVMTPLL